jgi:hypothetical protein
LVQSCVLKNLALKMKPLNWPMIHSELLAFSTVSMSSAGLQLVHCVAYELISLFLFDSYGLAGAVISRDRERCQRISEVCTSDGVYSIWLVT